MNLLNGNICDIPIYPGADEYEYPVTANYVDSLGKVVVLRNGESGPSETRAFDGSNWSLLPNAADRYSMGDTLNSVEKKGWWIAGRTYTGQYVVSAEYTSEILEGNGWVPGQVHSSTGCRKKAASFTLMKQKQC